MTHTHLIAILTGLVAVAYPAESQCTLPLPRQYPVQGDPTAMIVADLDGNGRTDIVPLVQGSSLWPDGPRFELQPDGTLLQLGNVPVVGNAASGVAADMNGDGILDLIYSFSTSAGSIKVALATSPGVYATPLTTATGQFPTTVIAADVTGDGLPDVIARDNSGILLLRNLGGGVLDTAQLILSGSHVGLVAADLDQDGDTDIATLSFGGNSFVRILVNSGSGTFTQNPDISTATSARALAIADMNNDGKPDIVTAARSNRLVAVHLATSSPLVYTQTTVFTPLNPNGITIADINRDGWADVLVSNEENQGSITLHLNNGSGALLAAQLTGSGPNLKSIAAISASANSQPLIVTLGSSGVTLHPTSGTSGSVTGPTLVNGRPNSTSGTIADMNQDGRPDVVGLSSSGLIVMLRQADGTYAAPAIYAVANPGGASAVIARDFNGDNYPDILFLNGDSADARIALNNGSGGLLAPVSYPGVNSFYQVSETDVNSDGRLDYFIRGYNSSQGRYLIVQPDGSLTATTPVSLPSSSNTAVIDVDLDGRLDYVSATPNDDLSFNIVIQRTLENGSLSNSEYFSVPERAYALTSADFDGDGREDLAVRTETCVFILKLNSQSQPVIIGQYPVSTTPGRLLTCDLDGDGFIDVVSLNYTTPSFGGGMHLLRGRGDGSFDLPIILPNGYNPNSISAGDVNGDGNKDLLIASQGTGATSNFCILSGPFFPCRADFNCDDIADFFDYADFVQSFAAGTSDADFNQDGTIDLFDYLDFVAAFARGC